jgi:stage V sporulation protein B
MTKGLGQQKICVLYNILTSAMDVALLFLLLPELGMIGYYLSFTVTHILNFLLSLRCLMKITGYRFALYIPLLAIAGALAAGALAIHVSFAIDNEFCYVLLLTSILFLSGILGREDLQWLRKLISQKNK